MLNIKILSAIILALSIWCWFTYNELENLRLEYTSVLAETEVLKTSNNSLLSSLNLQSNNIKVLEARQKAKNQEVNKTITKINTRYVARYELVKDTNETTECDILKRIIDEEVNSSAAISSI